MARGELFSLNKLGHFLFPSQDLSSLLPLGKRSRQTHIQHALAHVHDGCLCGAHHPSLGQEDHRYHISMHDRFAIVNDLRDHAVRRLHQLMWSDVRGLLRSMLGFHDAVVHRSGMPYHHLVVFDVVHFVKRERELQSNDLCGLRQ